MYDAVILASEESRNNVLQAINKIKKQSISPNNIYLVTNHPKHNNFSDVQEIFQTEGGIGKARQIGFNRAKSKWILFTDSDTRLPKNFVEEAFHFANKNKLDMVGARMKPRSDFALWYVLAEMSNLYRIGKGHSTFTKTDLNFSEVSNNRGEDLDMWLQGEKRRILSSAVKTQIPTTNHKKILILMILLLIVLLKK